MVPTQRLTVGRQSRRSLLCRFLLAGVIAGGADFGEAHTAWADFVGASAATVVTPVEGGGFEYRYTITNTSTSTDDEVIIAAAPSLLTWGMPFFDDAATSFVNGEASIFAPAGWTWLFTPLTPGTSDDELWPYVAADDPKNDSYGAPGSAFDDPPFALVFFVDPFSSSPVGILPGESLGDFGYVSPFEGTNIPFIAGFDNLQLTIGDPIGPETPTFPGTQQVPEPGSLALLGTGALTGLVAVAVRRRRERATST